VDGSAVISLEDRLAINELLGLYGHLIDQRRWSELDHVFTPDIVFDATSFGQQVTTSARELIEWWRSDLAMHPLAHHATNIVISEDADGTVRVLSKAIGVGRKGRVGSATYDDVVVRTADGWRLASRVATLRRSDA
jgi:hypothetical protein